MTETSGRLLKLLSLLQTRRDWPGNELAQRLGVSGRTIRRDVERLRDLGYPVDATTGPAGGYSLHAGTAMPPLLLDDDEAVAIAVGLRTAAGASVTGIEETAIRALVKLEQVLPSHLRRRVNALGSVLATLPASGPMVDPQALTTIAGACRDRERLRFAYRSREDAGEPPRRRAAQPRQPRPALVPRRLGLRSRGLADVSHRPPRAPRAGGRALRAAHAAGEGSGGVRRRRPARRARRATRRASRCTRPAAELEQRPYLWGTVEAIDEERCTYRTSDDSLDWLAMRIGMLGVDFEVHEPPELAERCAQLAARFGRARRAERLGACRMSSRRPRGFRHTPRFRRRRRSPSGRRRRRAAAPRCSARPRRRPPARAARAVAGPRRLGELRARGQQPVGGGEVGVERGAVRARRLRAQRAEPRAALARLGDDALEDRRHRA